MKIKTWAILGGAVFASHGAHAEAPADSEAVDVDTLVARALDSNPELAVYEAAINFARANERQAGLWENPELSIGGGQNKIKSGGGVARGHVITASLAQRIEFPKRVELRKAIANGDVRIAELGLRRFRDELENRIRLEAFRMISGIERARMARAIADRSKRLTAYFTERDPAGVAPALQMRALEAHVVHLGAEAMRREREAHGHRLELSYLLGDTGALTLDIEPFTPELLELPDDGELAQLARSHSFDLAFHMEEIAQQGYRVNLARTERWPEITIEPFYERQTGGGNQDIIGLGVSLPLPLWNRKRSEVDAARAREDQLRAAFEVTTRRLWRDIADFSNAYRLAREESKLWMDGAIEEFSKAASLAERHFQLGAIEAPTYLELQSQYLSASQALLDRQESAFENLLKIEALLGVRLDEEVE